METQCGVSTSAGLIPVVETERIQRCIFVTPHHKIKHERELINNDNTALGPMLLRLPFYHIRF